MLRPCSRHLAMSQPLCSRPQGDFVDIPSICVLVAIGGVEFVVSSLPEASPVFCAQGSGSDGKVVLPARVLARKATLQVARCSGRARRGAPNSAELRERPSRGRCRGRSMVNVHDLP